MNTIKNNVRLMGNLGQNPDVKEFEPGKKVARFSIATNEQYTNSKGEKVTETNWHNCVAWGKTAEIIEKYLSKGSEIAIDGRLTSRSYTTKEGEKKYVTEVVVNEMMMLGKKTD